MSKKHIISMTYKPKIEKVFSGVCCQTIRTLRKKSFEVGDQATIFEWSGRPYYSEWGRRLEVKIIDAEDLIIYEDCVFRNYSYEPNTFYRYLWSEMSVLAHADGISPPTGEELKRVLTGGRKIPDEGIKMKIIRWR
ncbi:MAG: hypothetical protein SVR08_14160 [Spirochaetota bacterium]|nr:hypothetical protein [Spirochaetota bacterium]